VENKCPSETCGQRNPQFNWNLAVVSIFWSIDKAFDTTWHSGLLQKLSKLQFFFGAVRPFFKLLYYTDNIYKVYKDKLKNCSCNQFHFIGTYKQVEKNSMTKNRGGNNGSEK
jgi:hypothetical protein